ncbi:MAG: RNB domain-containing ribonuclease, partial [Bacteroidetes bacterium]|nr:RNB domain-containing ribonuclease [Bacteroidota bacterium]
LNLYQSGSLTHKVVSGVVDMTMRGSAYVISNEIGADVFVQKANLNTALDGDVVKVALYRKRSGKKTEGKVVEVVERAQTQFLGTFIKENNVCYLSIDKRNMHYDIFIPGNEILGARNGDKAVAVIDDWKFEDPLRKGRRTDQPVPVGRIISVLGKPGVYDVEMDAILIEHGFPLEPAEEVLAETEKFKEKPSEAEIQERMDFRDINTFTIDPEDAKDFDDAISVSKTENDSWEIGVHIAVRGLRQAAGRSRSSRSRKLGLAVSRSDRMTSAPSTPHARPMSGSSQATPNSSLPPS